MALSRKIRGKIYVTSHRCAIDADYVVKPDGQSVISFAISNGCPQSLSFSDRWSRATKILGTRLL